MSTFSNRRQIGGEIETITIDEIDYVKMGEDLYKYDENGELIWVGAYSDYVKDEVNE